MTRRLALFALAVVVGHHVGTIAKPLGTAGPTEWADWIDLLTPYAVVGAAASVLLAVRAAARAWVVLVVASLAYVQGHGLHLAANSVSNAGPTGRAQDAAHLWDEAVSHYLWYAGLAGVVVALALAVLPIAFRPRPTAHALAALVGLTWTTNSIEGGTAVLGLLVAAVLAAWGWRERVRGAGRLLVTAYGLSLVTLAGWGIWHRGFPQFSELGWI